MKELISDFKGLREFITGSGLKFNDALIVYYKSVGEKQGFTVVSDSSVIRGAYNFGKVDLVWVEPNVVFAREFGVLDDIFRHLWRIMLLKPAVAVLLLSGNSQCSPKKVREIVSKTPQLLGIEFIILDVTGGKTV